ncbi:hypothetical protein [Aquibacillus albus]|uniref:Glycoside hydrolase n=1 Tax=Aquibacillus albus TaxID=1168171 RepID=A0ABS2N3N9_9BACI|nr:hypothetical protein [Aquibacillus albus]MBM7572716.1 hypothetical protein [Aquibacillus albus]
MQHYSFDLKDPTFDIAGLTISIHLHTMENIYGLDPSFTKLYTHGNKWLINCTQLSWAGQQQQATGFFKLEAIKNDKKQIVIKMEAEAKQKIKSVKLLVKNLNPMSFYETKGEERFSGLQSEGVFYYPYNPFAYNHNLKVPLLSLRDHTTNQIISVKSEENKIRAKRFVYYPELQGQYKGTYTLELIHDELAVEMASRISIPSWIIDMDSNPKTFLKDYLAFAESEKGIGLTPFEKRSDFPEWFREVSLVLTLHGMHWSGYVFNSYKQMLEIVKYATERIEGKHILVYLPGWEGRYYWQYGKYRPDPQLGGEDDFALLCRESSKLGVHMMPMFGSNCANLTFDNFAKYGLNSLMKTPSRLIYHVGEPDWDLSRQKDNGWQAFLNVGAPDWRRELTRQILELYETYQFDSIFLDLVHHWSNDPDYEVFEGLKKLKKDLTNYTDLFVAGENWYDGLLSIFPLFQVRPNLKQPKWVGRYAKTMAHLLEAEPSRGSTGVHERGYTKYERRLLQESYIPTIAFVDGTFENEKEEFNAIIRQGLRYKKEYIDS